MPCRRRPATRTRRRACRWRRSSTTTTSATWASAAWRRGGSRPGIASFSRTSATGPKSSGCRRCSASRGSSGSSSPRRGPGTSWPSRAWRGSASGTRSRRSTRRASCRRSRSTSRRSAWSSSSTTGRSPGPRGSTSRRAICASGSSARSRPTGALRVDETADPGTFKVSGRGELHLSVLIETMRREGYELCVSQPKVIFKTGAEGERVEPYEEVVIDVEEAYSGAVIEELGRRAGRMTELHPSGEGRVRIEYFMPSRGLIGYRSQFLTDTRGTGVLYHQLAEYGEYAGPLRGRTNGVLIVQEMGETNTYALFYLQERGVMLLGPGQKVYPGQIMGIHSRDNDLVVNPSKAKKLTNIRT